MRQPAPFKPRRWLRNRHLQTVVGNFLPRRNHLPPATTELVDVPLPPEMHGLPQAVATDRKQPGRILCLCHWQPDRGAPVVVLVHGLEGSAHSQYVGGNADKLWHAGMSVVRMNMRSCGGTDALVPTLYHSGMSCDVVAVLQWLLSSGQRRVVLAGYSMGGNLVLKALGELGSSAPPQLIGAVAVSPPMDLRESADALHHWSNRLYERRFRRGLLAHYRRKARLFPAIFEPAHAELVHSIRDFDEYVMSPHCGFRSANDYYAQSASARLLHAIQVPTLVLHALDDPFIRLTSATRAVLQTQPCITLVETAQGGHCAFLEDASPGYDGRWAERTLLAFVEDCVAAHPETASC